MFTAGPPVAAGTKKARATKITDALKKEKAPSRSGGEQKSVRPFCRACRGIRRATGGPAGSRNFFVLKKGLLYDI